MATPSRPYLSNGKMLESPPLSAKVRQFFSSLYMFLGLYITTLLSLDAYAAAEKSPFNIRNQSTTPRQPRRGWTGGLGGGHGGSGSGPGDGGPGSGGGSKRVGRIDDIRGPECKSCQ